VPVPVPLLLPELVLEPAPLLLLPELVLVPAPLLLLLELVLVPAPLLLLLELVLVPAPLLLLPVPVPEELMAVSVVAVVPLVMSLPQADSVTDSVAMTLTAVCLERNPLKVSYITVSPFKQ
jgi:hypothetical protein